MMAPGKVNKPNMIKTSPAYENQWSATTENSHQAKHLPADKTEKPTLNSGNRGDKRKKKKKKKKKKST
jgi:hypothetical protein